MALWAVASLAFAFGVGGGGYLLGRMMNWLVVSAGFSIAQAALTVLACIIALGGAAGGLAYEASRR